MKPASLVQAWQRRALREKVMLAGGALLVLAAAADALWTAPLEKRLKRARAETGSLQERLQETQRPALGGALSPAQMREQEASLRQRLQAAQTASASVRQRVGEAARLPETLRAITATVGAARLLELDLAGDVEAPAVAAASAPMRRLYRLPITLKVSGSYDELQLLLTQIERHADALQWSSVALDSSDWPAIQLTLKAHVLSLDPRWGAS
jgi:type II secretory pathway component PulM